MNLCDYEDGTAFIVLYKSDFVNQSRFKDYAEFMNQDTNAGFITIPVDSTRVITKEVE